MNFQAFSQDFFCGTTETEQDIRKNYPELGSIEDLYKWYLEESKKLKKDEIEYEYNVQTIPVIFHIIHDDESVGVGNNIPAENIHNQLNQLNNDFRRKKGTTGWNDHPDGADTQIEFCLAAIGPDGELLERGINRINRKDWNWSEPFYSYNYIESTIKPDTQWDPTKYVNIWLVLVVDKLAYARYPVQSGLGNITQGNAPANTDGIVIRNRLIGSMEFPGEGYSPNVSDKFSLFGKVLTHEMGHFFGLAHPWGEQGGCGNLWNNDDGCADTPNQMGAHNPTEDCPTFFSCENTEPDMTTNYMSNANGKCKNIFTKDQVIRMKTTLTNSPRRKELVNSTVCGYTCQPEWSGTIGEDEIWSTSSPNLPPNNGYQIGKIYIEDGATLNIQTDITFASGGEIYIKPGGTLILSGKLTACDRWNGIRIYGENNKKGVFVGRRGALIEHAMWGISTTNGTTFLGEGEIDCQDVVFRNNGVAAMIGTKNGIELEHKKYQAKFKFCSFENNNQLRHEKFWAFITTYNLDGVNVYGCHFVDKQTNSTYPNSYNAGIVALNGNVNVWQGNFSSISVPSYFEGLHLGVEARAFGADLSFEISNSTFRDCKIGILNSGYSSPIITDNTFQFQKIFAWDYKAAIHLEDGMNNITVQDNLITGFVMNLNLNTNGIFINNIGASTNKIRRNTFVDLWYPNSAKGTNASHEHGLIYLCNKHYQSQKGGSDISAYFGYSIADIQGLIADEFVVLPTENLFSNNSYDFLNIGDNASSTEYHFDKTINNGHEPTNYYGIKPIKEEPSQHCENPLKPPLINSDEAETNEQKYLSFNQKYQLSKHNFENAELNSITEELSQMKMSMAYNRSILDETVSRGYEYAKNITKNRDQKRIWMRRFNNITGAYLLANDFFSNGEYTQGLQVLSDVLNKYELSEKQIVDLKEVKYIYERIITSGIDSLDELTLQKLETFAESEKGKSCFIARTVLRNYGKYYLPITPQHSDIPGFSTDIQSNSDNNDQKKMSVFPNPADYNVTFDWKEFLSPTKKATLEITNQSGQLVDILKPPVGSTSVEWTTESVNNGKCYYRLLLDNKEVDSGQIIIQK